MRRYPGYLLFLPLFLFANPQGEQVTSGSCQFDRSGSSLTIIQHSEHAIIDWQHFSVQFNETTHFLQSPTSAVLNRVVGNNPTEIHGTLKSTGMVYLINQNGILIGPNGRIQTGGFLASTLELASGENLGEDLLFKGTHDASIDFQGSIETLQGPVYFISRNVYENGKVEADSVHLLAGTEVFISHPMGGVIKVSGEGKLEQKGTIEALKMELQSAGSADSFAIQQEGILHASGFLEDEGRIILCSDQGSISVSGSMHASQNEHGGTIHVLGEEIQVHEKALIDVSAPTGGGKILIGGDYQGENPEIKNATLTTVYEKALLLADATEKGDGGKVIVWADDTTKFHGHISAQALGDSGDGGFAEVSGKREIWISGHADLRARNGNYGTMLCDPGAVTIDNGAGGGPNTFGDTFIITQLGLGNFTVTTANGTLGTPEVLTFFPGGSAPQIIWGDATLFTAIGRQNVIFGNGTTVQNTNAVSGNFDAIRIEGNANASGNFIGVDVNSVTITAVNGNITIIGTGGDTAGINPTYGVRVTGTGGVTTTGAGASAGSITINGTGGASPSALASGFHMDTSFPQISTQNGNISITGQGGGNGTTTNIRGINVEQGATISTAGSGSITMNGTGGNAIGSGDGIRITSVGAPTTTISSVNGIISMTGQGAGTGASAHGVNISSNDPLVTSTGTGSISIIGTASATATGSNGVHMNASGNVTTLSGNISIDGTGSALSGFGVNVSTNNVATTGGGSVFIIGRGIGTSSVSLGVSINLAATISTAAAGGNISITGTAGVNAINNNRGVQINGAGSAITTVSGAIGISGTGGGDGTSSNNIGVLIDGGGAVSTDTGTITVNGNGGPGFIGNHGVNLAVGTITSNISGDINVTGIGLASSGASSGVLLFGGNTTNITSNGSGMITVNATGGTGGDNQALFLRGTTPGSPVNITSVNGDIFLRGTGTGAGVNNDGITIFNGGGPARVETTGTGTLTMIGVATGALGIGIHLNSADAIVTTSDPAATISLTGTGSGAGTGIRLDPSDFIGSTTTAPATTTTAPIILTADDMRLNGPVSTSSTITVQPLNPGAAMGIGPSAPGVLTLNAIDLANLGSLTSPSMIIFGRSNGASTTSTDPTILTLTHPTTIQNANVDVLGPLVIGLNDLTVNIGTNGTGAFNLFDDITTTGGVIQVNGAGPAQNMTFNAFNNTVNTWNINSQNAGVFNSGAGFAANFSNVGNLVGGNQDDTFVFVNQQGLSGIVDGGFPPAINTLDYAGWNPPAIVQFIGPFDGIASNIDGGFFNIFRAVGNFTDSIVPNIPATFNTQVDLSFLYLFLQGKDDDLFTLFDIYLLSKVIYFPNALWLDIFADVLYQQEKDSLDILPLYQIIQDVPDPFVRGRLPHFAE